MEESRHRAASLKEFYHCLTDRFIVAAQYGRTSRLEKIYVLVAVTVVEVGAFGLDKALNLCDFIAVKNFVWLFHF